MGEKVLSLVRPSTVGARHDVVAKPLDLPWRWVAKDVSGRPAAAAVTKNQLHVLFRPLGYVVYDLETGERTAGRVRDPNETRWPANATHVAMCEAADVGKLEQAARKRFLCEG